MLSQSEIRTELAKIASDRNLTGDAVDLMVDELTYAIFHEQTEIVNALNENNLSTAYLINSKIRSCMNVMYSVYRGRNFRVKLKVKSKIDINFSKFDILFSSNTFNVYADESRRLVSGQSYSDPYSSDSTNREVIGILSNTPLYDQSYQVPENKWYIDFVIDDRILGNLSEEVLVSIDGVDYPTTRNFFDFIQEPLYNDITEGKNSIFVLTIPGYGIRIFKRGYFTISSTVRIRALEYTTYDEINSDEFEKITIDGTDILDNIDGYSLKYDNPNCYVKEVERDSEDSLLYQANFYSRLQSKILSKSDINNLFNEVFRTQVKSSINWFDGRTAKTVVEDDITKFSDGTIYIFYVPIDTSNLVLDTSFKNNYIDKYKSYFISPEIKQVVGYPININVDLILYLNTQDEQLGDKIKSIYNNYSYLLNNPNDYIQSKGGKQSIIVDCGKYCKFKSKQVRAEISKLDTVDYIDSLQYSYDKPILTGDTGGVITFTDIDTIDMMNDNFMFIPSKGNLNGYQGVGSEGNEVYIPTYYTFTLNIQYKYTYTTVNNLV